eukprot:COSAG03_NODE_8350_length_810_cov_3.786217_1_plen_119_part_10
MIRMGHTRRTPERSASANNRKHHILLVGPIDIWNVVVLREHCISTCNRGTRFPILKALAAAHASPDLQLTDSLWMTWVLGHAAWVCLCQIASQQLKRPSPTPAPKSSRLEMYVCNCVLS